MTSRRRQLNNALLCTGGQYRVKALDAKEFERVMVGAALKCGLLHLLIKKPLNEQARDGGPRRAK
jgi:hypothetical protein